jgi:hypothetical protein
VRLFSILIYKDGDDWGVEADREPELYALRKDPSITKSIPLPYGRAMLTHPLPIYDIIP